MKSRGFTLLSALALALLGPCFGTGLANAQGLTGNFTLPFEAHWGLATLPAGEYSFTVEHAPRGMLRLYRGTAAVAMIYAQSYDQKASGRAVLVVTGDDTINVIRQMVLPSAGLVLYYAPHEGKRGSAQQERRAAWTVPIPVTVGGM